VKLAILAAAAIGLALGLGAYTFVYAKGASYLSTDPAVCANCHIMGEHFAAWQRSSHRAVAGCSDCHMPHDVVRKYLTKASNGFWHSVAFTSGRFPDPLMIKRHNRAIVEQACRHCHEAVTEAIQAMPAGAGTSPTSGRPQLHDGLGAIGDGLSCTFCHTYAGHWVR
jgi:cytochrome c nitrite reductase small subunit